MTRPRASRLSAADWVEVVAPRLTGALADPAALGRVHRLARRLPGCCFCGVELRLGGAAGAVDFGLLVDTPMQASLLAPLLEPPHARRLMTRWSSERARAVPGGRLRSRSRALWLEFDLPGPSDELPAPGLFVHLEPDAETDWITRVLLPRLAGRRISAAHRRAVRRCCEALPPHARLLHLGRMLGRDEDAVRLDVLGLSQDEAVEVLIDLDARPEAERLAELAPLTAGAERLHLSFSVGERVLERVGLEYSFGGQPRSDRRWAAALERLVGAGLCDPAKRDAVLAFPGRDTAASEVVTWPAAAGAVGEVCARVVSHFKLASSPAGTEAKAYAFFGPVAGAALAAALARRHARRAPANLAGPMVNA